MFELARLEILILYQKIKRWLVPPVKPISTPFLGRGMVMDLDPKFVAERALLSKVISEHLESRQYFGFISEEEKERWYVALSKTVTPLRTKVKTKEQRRQKVEEMKAQRLNGHPLSKSIFPQLKDSLSCTKV